MSTYLKYIVGSLTLLSSAAQILTHARAQEPKQLAPIANPADQFAPKIKSMLAKAKSSYNRIRNTQEKTRIPGVAESQAIQLRDWFKNQEWEFTTRIRSEIVENGQTYLVADAPAALLPYVRNLAAYDKGGVCAHSLRVAIPDDKSGTFRAGDEVAMKGVMQGTFANDVPDREKSDPTLVLCDVILPPVDDVPAKRVEVSMIGVAISGAAGTIQLPGPARPAQPAAKAADDKPTLELALTMIETQIADLVVEAKRQKNTALVSETIEERESQLMEKLDGQEWSFRMRVRDVVRDEHGYSCALEATKSLLKFTKNDRSYSSGGLFARAPVFRVDRTLAANLGRGDVIEVKGKTLATPNSVASGAGFGGGSLFGGGIAMPMAGALPLTTDSFVVFQVFMPPLDGQRPAGFSVILDELSIQKVAAE